jgi:hypothetical protein
MPLAGVRGGARPWLSGGTGRRAGGVRNHVVTVPRARYGHGGAIYPCNAASRLPAVQQLMRDR